MCHQGHQPLHAVIVGMMRVHVRPPSLGDTRPLVVVCQVIGHQFAQVSGIAVGDQVLAHGEPLAHAGPVVGDLQRPHAARLEEAHIAAPAHEIAVRIDRDLRRAGDAQHLLAQRRGAVITIGSLTTAIGLPGRALYGATKGAIGLLTRTLAVEWGPYGVRVNCIAPGWIYTDLSKGVLDDPAFRAQVLARTPLGRIGQPQDLVGLAVFLASPAAAFITGQIIFADGGYLAG